MLLGLFIEIRRCELVPRSKALSPGCFPQVSARMHSGYRKKYDYLPKDVEKELNVERDGLYLYRQMFPAKLVFFSGMTVSGLRGGYAHLDASGHATGGRIFYALQHSSKGFNLPITSLSACLSSNHCRNLAQILVGRLSVVTQTFSRSYIPNGVLIITNVMVPDSVYN